MRTDVAELMDQGKAGQDRPVIHVNVACQGSIVDQNHVVADHAVMPDMGIGHDQVVIAQRGFGTVLNGPAVNGHAFADHVVIADDKTGFLALVFQIRRVLTHR